MICCGGAGFCLFHEFHKAHFYHRSGKWRRGTEILGEMSIATVFLPFFFSSGSQRFEAPARLSAGKPSFPSPFAFLVSEAMPKVKRSRKPPPDGWELIEPTLDELDQKMREGEQQSWLFSGMCP